MFYPLDAKFEFFFSAAMLSSQLMGRNCGNIRLTKSQNSLLFLSLSIILSAYTFSSYLRVPASVLCAVTCNVSETSN